MSNINKQALREAAEKADSGEWSYEEFNRLDLPGGASIKINGRGAVYCLKKPVGGVEPGDVVITSHGTRYTVKSFWMEDGKVTLFGADGSETEYDYYDMLNVERD